MIPRIRTPPSDDSANHNNHRRSIDILLDFCGAWVQAGSLGAQLQAHSLQGSKPLTLQLPISKRVPLEGAELVAFQEQKRKEEMGALQRPAPQAPDATLAEPLPTRLSRLIQSLQLEHV